MLMYKITIDPGHGGKDRTNIGQTGYVEADGTLKIALYLEKELLRYNKFEVFLTRRQDMTLSLTERGREAANNKSDLFISEHTNAANKMARGTTAFYSVDLPGDKMLAERLSAEVSRALGIPDRGAKTRSSPGNPGEDYYTVIDTAQDGGIPHVILIENAFHDNLEDEKLLMDDLMLQKIAEAQARVISKWFGGAEGTSQGTPSGTSEDNKALPVLKQGSTGEAVKLLQVLLNKLNFGSGAADGIFGTITNTAVINFQKSSKLAADGIAGPKTWNTIIDAFE